MHEIPEHEKRSSVLQFVKELLRRREEDKEGESFEHLPDPLQQRMREFERELPAHLTDDERRPIVQKHLHMIERAYVDTRFNMPNRTFSHENVMTEIENLMSSLESADGVTEESIEAAERMAFIAFDLDGLKAVNDITASHKNGDAYLGLFAHILREGKTITALKKEGITTMGTVDGGDEFSLFLQSEREPLTQEKIDAAIKGIQDELRTTTCVACINMDDARVKEALALRGLTPPEEYVFRGSVSGAGLTVLDALYMAQVKAKAEPGYQASLRVIAEMLRDTADARSQDVKLAEKKRRSAGTEEERFYEKMIQLFRGVSMVEFLALQRRLQEVESENERLRAEEGVVV